MSERLKGTTYAVQYNPKCPSRFLVRLCGIEACNIDCLPRGSKDIRGYGNTLIQAAREAFKAYDAAYKKYFKRPNRNR